MVAVLAEPLVETHPATPGHDRPRTATRGRRASARRAPRPDCAGVATSPLRVLPGTPPLRVLPARPPRHTPDPVRVGAAPAGTPVTSDRTDRSLRSSAPPVAGRRANGSRRAVASGPVLLRRRLAALLFVVGLLAVIWFSLQGALGGAGGGPLTTTGIPGGRAIPVAARTWVVQPGDTVWAIAAALQPRGDIRPLVDRLVAETAGRPLQVGQRIALP